MEIKINIGNPKDGSTVSLALADGKPLYGKRVGDEFKGELLDKTGWVFKITGGSDNAGFPMRSDVDGSGRRKVLLAGGVGYRPKRNGMRSRRTVAGNTVGQQTAQINCQVIKEGKESLTAAPETEESGDAE